MDTAHSFPMHVEPATGLLTRTRQVLSTHFDARPVGCQPDLIVIHGISLPPGEYGVYLVRAAAAGGQLFAFGIDG